MPFLPSLFLVAWTMGVGSFLLAVIEGLGVHLFYPRAFRVGPILLRRQFPCAAPATRSSDILLPGSPGGVARLIGPHLCLVRPRYRFGGLHTPFSLRGEIRFDATTATAVLRAPLGSSLFFCCWLLGWTAGAVMMMGSAAVLPALGMLAFGWLFVGLLIWFSLRVELRRAEELLASLQHMFGTNAA